MDISDLHTSIILVASADPIFRAGVRALLGETWGHIEPLEDLPRSVAWIAGTSPRPPVWLVILQFSSSDRLDMLMYQQLQQQTPPIPLLVVGQGSVLPLAPLPGVSVLWGEHRSADRLRDAMEILAQGQSLWWIEQQGLPLVITPSSRPRFKTPIHQWIQGYRTQGLYLVQQDLQRVEAALQHPDLSWLDRQVLEGERRELLMVQWFLSQGTAPPIAPDANPTPALSPVGSASPNRIANPTSNAIPQAIAEGLAPDVSSVPSLAPVAIPLDLERLLFDRVSQKLTSPLLNLTPIPLELDALNLARRRELLLLILQALGDRLTELRHSQITPEQLAQQDGAILGDLWKDSLTHFFGEYTLLQIEGQSVPLVPRLLDNPTIARSFILNKIPHWYTLLAAILFRDPVLVDGCPYRCESPEAIDRLELLLENLMLQVGNAVMQPLLNECANVESIKQTFFHPRLLSTRQIERFRNNLSWKYRVIDGFEEPRHIYESCHALLVIQPDGIHRITIYSPRQGELNQLTPWQQTLTLGLEFRDALAPRLQALTGWLGQGIVYLLTQVVGRGLGLIGRGIVQGLGSVWDSRR